MKNNFAKKLSVLTILSFSMLAACGGGGGGKTEDITFNFNVAADTETYTIKVSGPDKQKDWLKTMLNTFNKLWTKHGGAAITWDQVEYEESTVGSDVPDWSTGPDVFAFASDQIMDLFNKGALSAMPDATATEFKNDLIDDAIGLDGKPGYCLDVFGKFANKYVAYPFCSDNGYFLYYDKSVLTETDVQTVEGILAKASSSAQFAYNITDSFYGMGELFSWGARYSYDVSDSGVMSNIKADFNTSKGVKAAMAGQTIVQAKKEGKVTYTLLAPTAANSTIATVDGSWNVKAYKEAMGANYACTKLPTITYDGQTHNLGSFLGYKMYGVNKLPSSGSSKRLALAHEIARFLTSKDVQRSRYNTHFVAPTNKALFNEDAIKNDEHIKAINAQKEFSVSQTAVPPKTWTAGKSLYAEIEQNVTSGTPFHETGTDALSMTRRMKNFNTEIKKTS